MLKLLDEDHFWIDGLLVDINQLYTAANMVGRKALTDAQIHNVVCGLQYLTKVSIINNTLLVE